MNKNKIAKFIEQLLIIGFISVCLIGCSSLTVSSKNENQPLQTESKNENVEIVKSETTVQKKEVLWDFRKNEDAPPTLSKAETNAVLKYLFGTNANPEMIITNRVSGSFTKPNANETLYFITGCIVISGSPKDGEENPKFTTDCPHVAWNSDGWIAIYDGQTPVMKINESLGYGVSKVTDVNGDGISELFTTVGYSNGGATESSGSLGQFKNGKYIDIKSFDGYKDNCAYGSGEMSANAAVINYVPTTSGKMPIFTVEYFQNKCAEPPVWKRLRKSSLMVND